MYTIHSLIWEKLHIRIWKAQLPETKKSIFNGLHCNCWGEKACLMRQNVFCKFEELLPNMSVCPPANRHSVCTVQCSNVGYICAVFFWHFCATRQTVLTRLYLHVWISITLMQMSHFEEVALSILSIWTPATRQLGALDTSDYFFRHSIVNNFKLDWTQNLCHRLLSVPFLLCA